MSAAGLEVLAVGGLLLFVGVFVGVCVWAATRSRREVDTWSSLPLADGTDPVEPRTPEAQPTPSDPDTQGGSRSGGGCGKCLHCYCQAEGLVTVTSLTAT